MKSRYLIFFSLLIIAFSSCKKGESELGVGAPATDVKLEILNDTLVYFSSQDKNVSGYKNKEEKEEKEKSYNTVRYRLTNNSDKKYLFFIKDLELVRIKGMRLIFKEESGEIVYGGFTLKQPSDSAFSDCYLCEVEQEKVYKDKVEKLGSDVSFYFYRDYMPQIQIINPGESWEFSAGLSLPMAIREIGTDFYFPINEKTNYIFYIEYKLQGKVFSEAYLKQLQNNNVEIFKGKLISNEVAVVPNI